MAASAERVNADAEQPAQGAAREAAPSAGAADAGTAGAARRVISVADLLRSSRFVVLPLDGIEEQVL